MILFSPPPSLSLSHLLLPRSSSACPSESFPHNEPDIRVVNGNDHWSAKFLLPKIKLGCLFFFLSLPLAYLVYRT